MEKLEALVESTGVMPILFAEEDDCAERVVRAIERSKMPAVEILQRGEAALKVLKDAVKIKKNSYVGAGTVCTLDQCKKMADVGADFIVSPGYSPEIVDWCMKNGIPVVPGASNPTEVMMAVNAGVKIAKFFPFYELGGAKYLNGIAGPFADIKFIITGGVDDRELCFVSEKRIAAVGGVWMFQSEEDHTVVSEDEIVRRMNKSAELAGHYKKRWE